MKMTVARRLLAAIIVTGCMFCRLPPVAAGDPGEKTGAVAQNQGQGTTSVGPPAPGPGGASNQSPGQAPNRTPDLYPHQTPRQSPDGFPVPAPAQNPQSPPGQIPDVQAPGTVPGQPPNQTPDLYPSQTPRQSPENSPLQAPAQSPNGFFPQISSATVLPGASTGQAQGVSSSTIGGQPVLLSSVTQQGTTIQAMPGLPGGTTFFRQSGSNEGPRMMRQESRSAAISPVNRAIEEKSPEGVESDFTFRKDMDDRLERLDRQVGEIRMEAQDFSPDRKISLERKIDELRRDKNEVRAQLQDVVAPGAPKGHERSRAEESMDRLEQRYRDVYSDLRRSSPAGEKGNEAQRDAFLRDVGAKLGDLQKRIDGLSRSLQGTAGEQKRKLQQAVDELEKQRTGLQQKLDRLTAVGRGRWDRVKQEIDQGIDAMERTLRSTEEQQKSAGDGEGGQEEPPRRR